MSDGLRLRTINKNSKKKKKKNFLWQEFAAEVVVAKKGSLLVLFLWPQPQLFSPFSGIS